MEKPGNYSEGDWIVHCHYGLGQIKGIEVKGVSGEETSYYRIKATDSTFWIPVDQMDSPDLRPISTPEEIQKAIVTLEKPPKKMSSNYKTRQSRIQRVQTRNTPRAIARLIRDLRARRREKGILNKTERSAFRALKQQLAEEWAIATGINTEKATLNLDHLLNPNQVSDDDENNGETHQEKAATSSPSPSRKQRKWGIWPRRQKNKINK